MNPMQPTSPVAQSKRRLVQPQDRLGMSRVEVSEYIGVSPSLFDEMVKDGRMPPAKMINNRRVWSRLKIEKAFAELPEEGQDSESDNPWRDCA
jgi:predicted DNA-binding transcriptional regulator AlpA